MSESTVNKVVQQIGGGGCLHLFLWELLVDGLSISLLPIPINHSPDEIAFYGTISGTGLFSDSTHSINSVFIPWTLPLLSVFLPFILIALFLSLVFPSFYSELRPLGRMGLFITYFNFLGKY